MFCCHLQVSYTITITIETKSRTRVILGIVFTRLKTGAEDKQIGAEDKKICAEDEQVGCLSSSISLDVYLSIKLRR